MLRVAKIIMFFIIFSSCENVFSNSQLIDETKIYKKCTRHFSYYNNIESIKSKTPKVNQGKIIRNISYKSGNPRIIHESKLRSIEPKNDNTNTLPVILSTYKSGVYVRHFCLKKESQTQNIHEMNEDFYLWPNPSSDYFTINSDNNTYNIVNVKVFDINYNEILDITSVKESQVFDISNCTPGCYLVFIQTETCLFTKMLIIKK